MVDIAARHRPRQPFVGLVAPLLYVPALVATHPARRVLALRASFEPRTLCFLTHLPPYSPPPVCFPSCATPRPLAPLHRHLPAAHRAARRIDAAVSSPPPRLPAYCSSRAAHRPPRRRHRLRARSSSCALPWLTPRHHPTAPRAVQLTSLPCHLPARSLSCSVQHCRFTSIRHLLVRSSALHSAPTSGSLCPSSLPAPRAAQRRSTLTRLQSAVGHAPPLPVRHQHQRRRQRWSRCPHLSAPQRSPLSSWISSALSTASASPSPLPCAAAAVGPSPPPVNRSSCLIHQPPATYITPCLPALRAV